MSSGVRSWPRDIVDVDAWKSSIVNSITNFQREVPKIEEFVPQITDLQVLCQQDWFDLFPAADRGAKIQELVEKVKNLWDKIYDTLLAMEKQEPSLEICHLFKNKAMYPYKRVSYSQFDPREWGATVCEWRGNMENLRTWILGTSPESRRLTREAALFKYRTGLLTDACRAYEQIVQGSQQTVQVLLQTQTAWQRSAEVAEQVSLAAAAQTVSVDFFATLAGQLKRYTETPQAQIDEMVEFERQMQELEKEVAVLLAKEQQFDELGRELEAQRQQVAEETRQVLAHQLNTVHAMEERVVAITSSASQQSQGDSNERTVIAVAS